MTCLDQLFQMFEEVSTYSSGYLKSEIPNPCTKSHFSSIPMLTTRRRSGTCTPMPAQSVLTSTWICLIKVLFRHEQLHNLRSDPLRNPVIILSLSSLLSSPDILAIADCFGMEYLDSSSHFRRSHAAEWETYQMWQNCIRVFYQIFMMDMFDCSRVPNHRKVQCVCLLHDNGLHSLLKFRMVYQWGLPYPCQGQKSGTWCAHH